MIVKGSGPYWVLTQMGEVTNYVIENPLRRRYILDREDLFFTISTTMVFDSLKEAEDFIIIINKFDARTYNDSLK